MTTIKIKTALAPFILKKLYTELYGYLREVYQEPIKDDQRLLDSLDEKPYESMVSRRLDFDDVGYLCTLTMKIEKIKL
jgi:hypothetical protein